MKIKINDIGAGGLDFAGCLSGDVIGLTADDDIAFIDQIAVKARFERVDNSVFALTHVHSRLKTCCYRCLEESEQDWTRDFTIYFDIEKNMEIIELDEEIRQEVIMGLPQRILCRKDCKGICVGCGKNLNEEDCGCNKK